VRNGVVWIKLKMVKRMRENFIKFVNEVMYVIDNFFLIEEIVRL